jgi:hypothetical protein
MEVINSPMNSDDVARPWHLLDQEKYPRIDDAVADMRYSVCQGCDSLIAGVCKECGCIMKQKVKLGLASCPLEKW